MFFTLCGYFNLYWTWGVRTIVATWKVGEANNIPHGIILVLAPHLYNRIIPFLLLLGPFISWKAMVVNFVFLLLKTVIDDKATSTYRSYIITLMSRLEHFHTEQLWALSAKPLLILTLQERFENDDIQSHCAITEKGKITKPRGKSRIAINLRCVWFLSLL